MSNLFSDFFFSLSVYAFPTSRKKRPEFGLNIFLTGPLMKISKFIAHKFFGFYNKDDVCFRF